MATTLSTKPNIALQKLQRSVELRVHLERGFKACRKHLGDGQFIFSLLREKSEPARCFVRSLAAAISAAAHSVQRPHVLALAHRTDETI